VIKTKFSANYISKVCFILSPLAGFSCFFLPVLIFIGLDGDYNFISIVNYTYKNVLFMQAVILLFILGITMGMFIGKHLLLYGLLSVTIFPCVALYEIILDKTSHNLWPVEFIIYFIFSIPVIVGAFLGKVIKNKAV